MNYITKCPQYFLMNHILDFHQDRYLIIWFFHFEIQVLITLI